MVCVCIITTIIIIIIIAVMLIPDGRSSAPAKRVPYYNVV